MNLPLHCSCIPHPEGDLRGAGLLLGFFWHLTIHTGALLHFRRSLCLRGRRLLTLHFFVGFRLLTGRESCWLIPTGLFDVREREFNSSLFSPSMKSHITMFKNVFVFFTSSLWVVVICISLRTYCLCPGATWRALQKCNINKSTIIFDLCKKQKY